MNRNATAALAILLASAATLGLWQVGWNGPSYARVLSSRPVTVLEPRYADVVESVPVRARTADGTSATAWDVTYRQDGRLLHRLSRTEPADQVQVGEQRRVIGYDVAWRWRDHTGVVRLARRPGKRLPVEDGAVVAARRHRPLSG